jgi:hypothetical protein
MPSSTFFYMVKARDMKDWRTSSSNQGVRHSTFLQTGGNLISIPIPLSSNDPSTVFQDVDYDTMWAYNATDIADHWKQFNPLKVNNDLTFIDHKMALWLNITQDSDFTIAGLIPQSIDISLRTGWNLVSYPSFIDRQVSDALSGLSYVRVEGFDPSSPSGLMNMNDTDYMSAGMGYWIKVSLDDTWTVTN